VREYETTLIIQPEISDEAVQELRGRLDGIIEKDGAVLLMYDDQGRRRLAYEIQNFQKGRYLMLHFLDGGGVIPTLERALRLEDSVLRFLTVQVADEVADIEARKAQAAEEVRIRERKAAERAAREAEEAAERAAREAEEAAERAEREAEEAAAAETAIEDEDDLDEVDLDENEVDLDENEVDLDENEVDLDEDEDDLDENEVDLASDDAADGDEAADDRSEREA
jgi:small subunit ribosomal protein S6